MTRVRVKICCISSHAEAAAAMDAGADAIGLVGDMPSGPGVIDDGLIAEITARVPPGVDSFLLSARTSADGIIEHHRACRTSTIQLVDRVSTADRRRIRAELPGVRLVQVVHVAGPESLDEARESAEHAHAVLLDSGNPSLPVKEFGGTGRTHNWELSRRIVEALDVPVYLAGGLTPQNVAQAVSCVRPFGVDVCSGVRTDGARALDHDRLSRFMRAVPANANERGTTDG